MEEEQKVEVKNNSNGGEKKGKSVAAMILGIVSLVFSCIWWISIPCSIVGLILGIIGKKSGGRGMAITGIILSSISIALAVLVVLGFASLVGLGASSSLYY